MYFMLYVSNRCYQCIINEPDNGQTVMQLVFIYRPWLSYTCV